MRHQRAVLLSVLAIDRITKTLAVHLFRNSVLYDPTSTFSQVARSNIVLELFLGLVAYGLLRYAPLKGSIAAGGILGNALDSPKPGVIDFIHVGNVVFNLADVAVLLGVALVASSLIQQTTRPAESD